MEHNVIKSAADSIKAQRKMKMEVLQAPPVLVEEPQGCEILLTKDALLPPAKMRTFTLDWLTFFYSLLDVIEK